MEWGWGCSGIVCVGVRKSENRTTTKISLSPMEDEKDHFNESFLSFRDLVLSRIRVGVGGGKGGGDNVQPTAKYSFSAVPQ